MCHDLHCQFSEEGTITFDERTLDVINDEVKHGVEGLSSQLCTNLGTTFHANNNRRIVVEMKMKELGLSILSKEKTNAVTMLQVQVVWNRSQSCIELGTI